MASFNVKSQNFLEEFMKAMIGFTQEGWSPTEESKPKFPKHEWVLNNMDPLRFLVVMFWLLLRFRNLCLSHLITVAILQTQMTKNLLNNRSRISFSQRTLLHELLWKRNLFWLNTCDTDDGYCGIHYQREKPNVIFYIHREGTFRGSLSCEYLYFTCMSRLLNFGGSFLPELIL